jgi:carbamoyl-phosphate synthase large subunit
MINIFVSGASGIVGYGILRSLKKSDLELRLIGATIYKDSVAQSFCDVFEEAPLTNDSGYIKWLIKIIKKHNIDLLIPGIDDDMYKWADNVEEIEKSGTKVMINNLDLINLCKDKLAFYLVLKNKNNPYVIESSINTDFDFFVEEYGFPFILKPRRGFGSKGIVRVNNFEEFQLHKKNIGPVLIAQPNVGNDDEEYTTSAFCDGRGGFFASMTLKRKLSKDGYTEKAEVVSLPEIQNALYNLCDIFKPIGPTNFQFRMDKGRIKLLEINPRVSSSTSIRSSFGYNECEMAIKFFLQNKSIKQPVIKMGKAIRYIEDLIIFEK